MNVDLTLNSMMFPNLPNFTPDFGTKKSGENESVGTEEMCVNFMLPFSKQRPVSVTETSTTSAVESDCCLAVESSGITLTVGRPSFVGVTAKVYGKFNSGTTTVVYNDAASSTKSYVLHPGECLELSALTFGQSGYWGENVARSSSSILLVAAGAVDAAKTVSLPTGYASPYQSIKVVFPVGHAVSSDTAMTLNGVEIVSNQNGTLAPLPRHQITAGTYSVLMANVCLEMYFTLDYDGNGTPGWVVMGNPVLLSSSDYIIYADGKVGDEALATIRSGLFSTAPYGWLLCNNTTYNKSDYPKLWDVLPAQVKNITNNTFTIDLREATLKGTGLTSQASNHYEPDGLALGEFINDRYMSHSHPMPHTHDMTHTHSYQGWGVGSFVSSFGTSGPQIMTSGDSSKADTGSPSNANTSASGSGTTTEVKAVGVNFIIKAM